MDMNQTIAWSFPTKFFLKKLSLSDKQIQQELDKYCCCTPLLHK
ncbi:unnamed protein product [Moneuplotes crassus]|uniref:Uncharacterized protein n=1 Tax=Euplotes crassus TaxID=5936 RepID=A0AAD1U5D5_EUPCR|nr:unnamed protein product [Moneuplotes crassus]